MKERIVLAFAFVVALFGTTLAQEKQKEKVRIAARAGLYFSRFKFNDLPPEYTKPKGDDAFYLGIQVNVPLSNQWSIAPEVLYAISSSQSYDNLPHQLYQDQLSHLLIPIQLKYRLGKIGLFAGPQAEILLSAKGPYYDGANNQIIFNTDIKDRSYKKLSLSGLVGAEWVFKYRFGIDARYQFGLTDFRASNGSTMMTEHGTIKANAFQAGLFFRFGKKPKKTA
jgi:hypothetical protein